MKADHRFAQGELTEERYFDADHLLVEHSATSHHSIERVLIAAGKRERIKVRLPQYLAAPYYILKFDLLWTLPDTLARLLVQHFPFVIKPLPAKMYLPYETCLYWHERFHADAGIKWFMELILDTLVNQPAPGEEAAVPLGAGA